MLRPGVLAPCDVAHCKPAARGLLSLVSLLRASLPNATKRNAATRSDYDTAVQLQDCKCPMYNYRNDIGAQVFSPRETQNGVEKTGGARENAEEVKINKTGETRGS